MKKLNLYKSQRSFNNSLYAGLVAGVFVMASQMIMDALIKNRLLPDTLICKIIGVFVLALIPFLFLVLTFVLLNKSKGGKLKMGEDKIWFECKYCGFKEEVEKLKTDKCPKCGEKSTALKRLMLRGLKD